jgi:hypothetical protein
MTEHEAVRRILASYTDASGEERAAADAHIAACTACAGARASYSQVDALISAATDPALPPRLSRPFASLLGTPTVERGGGLGLVFGRALAPAALVLFLLIGVSVLAWSVANEGAPVTTTPTLTTTLTPTAITARGTGAALSGGVAQRPAPAFVPTPAPAPAPNVDSAILFAAPGAHARITP